MVHAHTDSVAHLTILEILQLQCEFKCFNTNDCGPVPNYQNSREKLHEACTILKVHQSDLPHDFARAQHKLSQLEQKQKHASMDTDDVKSKMENTTLASSEDWTVVSNESGNGNVTSDPKETEEAYDNRVYILWR